ncbi:MAG TPA: hypothetical protein VF408_00840, partial [Sediminibacterium sp.]
MRLLKSHTPEKRCQTSHIAFQMITKSPDNAKEEPFTSGKQAGIRKIPLNTWGSGKDCIILCLNSSNSMSLKVRPGPTGLLYRPSNGLKKQERLGYMLKAEGMEAPTPIRMLLSNLRPGSARNSSFILSRNSRGLRKNRM